MKILYKKIINNILNKKIIIFNKYSKNFQKKFNVLIIHLKFLNIK